MMEEEDDITRNEYSTNKENSNLVSGGILLGILILDVVNFTGGY